MQTWDSRQSWITVAGAVITSIIISLLTLQSKISTSAPFLAITAGIVFYWFNMRKYLRRKKWANETFPVEWRDILKDNVSYYSHLSNSSKLLFEFHIYIFLKENRITGIGEPIDDRIRLLIAASAVILLFGRPDWEYRHLPEILVYPGSFDRHYSYTSKRRKRNIAGIVVPQNAIVFSRPDLFYSFKHKEDAFHVGLHEFAHALDMDDGTAEGIPANLNPALLREWHDLIESELVRVRQKDSVLSPYAAKNSAELFAVAVEYFFESPMKLKLSHRSLYEALASYFNQDPAEVL